jgi:uncharacterized surface protein with fasciclin (FAS1) repeats
MRLSRRSGRLALGATVTLAAAVTVAPAASAAAPPKPAGTTSLASVLLADKSGFDHNGGDFDIVTAAVLAVLKAKPSSPVKVLTDGKVALTAFVPTDKAFRKLAEDVTGDCLHSEKDVFGAVAKLGIPTVEKVLLYHVVPGATITKAAALQADHAVLKTALGTSITVDVDHPELTVNLEDADTNDKDPRVVAFDVNKGNKQIAHGINRVLRPIDLP